MDEKEFDWRNKILFVKVSRCKFLLELNTVCDNSPLIILCEETRTEKYSCKYVLLWKDKTL